jgi:hypothetical protein
MKTREDYDGIIDNDGCHDSPEDDYDGDSRGVLHNGLPIFRDEREAHVLGTDPVRPCAATPTADDEPGTDAWPPDFNDNQAVSVTDVLFFKGQLNTNNGRFDFDGNGGVSITDVLFMKFYFNQSCAVDMSPGGSNL